MRARLMSWLLVLSMSVLLAPSISADPPKSEGDREAERDRPERDRSERGRPERGGPERGGQGRDRSERDRPGPGGPPPREHAEHGGPQAMEPGRMMRMMPIFAALDSDRDGTISSNEIEHASAALKKLDKNNDGKLDQNELRPDFAGRPGSPQRDENRGPRDREQGAGGPRDGAPLEQLMKLDKNKDGELSADELADLPERGKRMLSMADRDKSGSLSKAELNEFKERAEKMRQGRGDADRRPSDRKESDRKDSDRSPRDRD